MKANYLIRADIGLVELNLSAAGNMLRFLNSEYCHFSDMEPHFINKYMCLDWGVGGWTASQKPEMLMQDQMRSKIEIKI